VLEYKLSNKKVDKHSHGIEVNKEGVLKVLNSPKGQVELSDTQSKFVLLTHLNRRESGMSDKVLKDIAFKELPPDTELGTFMTS
jgi:hypothetical protein